ncbi:MAG: hypothetical protein J0L64_08975 [Acidobacteria bacterium]|nr:hypothetical protein [Acidobacteriota bacterium]
MSEWASLLAELERIDFELQRTSDPDALVSWARQRGLLLLRLQSLPQGEAGETERVRAQLALARGQELVLEWCGKRDQMRTEAGNLHMSRTMLQSLRPSRRGSYFNFES